MNNLLFSLVDVSNEIVKSLATLGVFYPILFNLFGVLATITKVSEYQMKKRDKIFIFAIVASCCWLTYFLLQGDFVSAFGNLIVVLQVLVFRLRSTHKWANSIFWLFFFIAIQLTTSLISFKTVYDIFPIVGGVLCTISYFVMKEKHYRYIAFFACTCWLLNSVTKGYLLASINDAASVISVVVAIIRYSILEKKENQLKESVLEETKTE